MGKTDRRRLRLKKDTLRALSDEEAARVVGGKQPTHGCHNDPNGTNGSRYCLG